MATLLEEQFQHVLLSPFDLISLKDAGISGGAYAMRELDEENLHSLLLSDPDTWPDIEVTLCTAGYIVTDGSHRWEVAKQLQRKGLYATCKNYPSENDVVEAAFRANLRHGKNAGSEKKGDYAYWLHLTFPIMEQNDIASRVGITQGAVSKAIARREEEARRLAQEEAELTPEEQRKLLKKTCKRFGRVAVQFLDEVSSLDDQELTNLFTAVMKRNEREKLARIGRLLSDPGEQAKAQFSKLLH